MKSNLLQEHRKWAEAKHADLLGTTDPTRRRALAGIVLPEATARLGQVHNLVAGAVLDWNNEHEARLGWRAAASPYYIVSEVSAAERENVGVLALLVVEALIWGVLGAVNDPTGHPVSAGMAWAALALLMGVAGPKVMAHIVALGIEKQYERFRNRLRKILFVGVPAWLVLLIVATLVVRAVLHNALLLFNLAAAGVAIAAWTAIAALGALRDDHRWSARHVEHHNAQVSVRDLIQRVANLCRQILEGVVLSNPAMNPPPTPVGATPTNDQSLTAVPLEVSR